MGKKILITLIAVAAVGAVGVGIAGTRAKSQNSGLATVETSSASAVTPTEQVQTESVVTAMSAEPIGEQKEGENVFRVSLENKTQKIITEVSVKDLTEDTYPSNMLQEGDVFRPDEKKELYYDASDALKKLEELNSDSSYSSSESVSPDYTVKITFDAGNSYELHSFPFGDMDEGQICYDEQEDVCYLVYTSKASGEEVNTLETEKQLKSLAAMDESATVGQEDPGTEGGTENTTFEEQASYEEPTGNVGDQEAPSFGDDTQGSYEETSTY